MKKLNNTTGISSILLIILAIGNSFILSHIKSNLMEAETPEWLAGMVAIIIISMGLITAFNILSIFLQFRHFKQASFLNSGTFVLGFFSLLMLTIGVVMLQDIGQETKVGFYSPGEWNMVFFSHLILGVFGLVMLAFVRLSAKQLNRNMAVQCIEKDEAVFLTVHQVGICSALLGFTCMLLLKLMNVPEGYLEGLFVFAAIVALFPYTILVLYWLMIKRREKITEWYDEKQFRDICQGALLTLGSTVLLAALVFVLMVFGFVPDNMMLWFPVYLCGTLLVFSLSNQMIGNG